MTLLTDLKIKYPGALAWAFGDTPDLADALASLVISGKKTASCGSLASFQNEENPPVIGSYNIILDGSQKPVCVIRLTAMRLVRFCDVTAEFARKEGEGDRSLAYWREAHEAFFTRAGHFSESMELVAEEFELTEVL